MAHPYANQPHRDLPPALNFAREMEQALGNRRAQIPRLPTHNWNRDEHDANPRVSQGQAQETPQQFNQIYVHPYSSRHYRFAVVDYSMTCHGPRPAPYPAYSFALVPEVATIRDIESALAHRSGLVVMARLSGPGGGLVQIGTFHDTGALYEASLQLEVRENHDRAENAPMQRNRGGE
ncbi:hypothetical protein F4801DRAFT_566257 [Xylaria longipes]|nr:hypothetical protein F4801DRAFT_566257 [Xylaria longipes]